MATKAIYPGTFDPVTNGHIDLITRASKLFHHVVVSVAASPTKKPLFTLEERVEMLAQTCKALDNVTIVGFKGLLVDFAKQQQAQVLLRGIRTVADFEYEHQLANMNKSLNHQIETVFLTPSIEYAFISSTFVKEVALHHGAINHLVPEVVAEKLVERLQQ